MKHVFLASAVVAVLAFFQPAFALQYISGHITQLEPTYMPDGIALTMDVGNTACPAGKWLWWANGGAAGGHQSSQAVYATMLAALLSGKKVDFIINDDDAGCKGQFFHLHVES